MGSYRVLLDTLPDFVSNSAASVLAKCSSAARCRTFGKKCPYQFEARLEQHPRLALCTVLGIAGVIYWNISSFQLKGFRRNSDRT